MKRLLTIALLFPFSLAAQTFTVGSTTQQLNPSQRGSVATFWPDGTMGAINHSGTNYVFAPVANSNGSGTEQITLPNLNTWSSGLSIVNPSSNFTLGPTNSWNQHYSAGQATYYDSGSGYLIQLIHGEQHFCSPAPCGGSPSYSALGLGYSTDFGNTWHLLGEVVSPQSAWTNGGTNCQADVSMGTLLVVGSYFYVYYDDTGTGCTPGEQLAVARAPISSVIAAAVAGTPFTSGAGTLFMKYTGGGGWTGNGVTDLANPQNGGGAYAQIATDFNGHGIYMPSVRYDSFINEYILAYTNFYDVALQTSSDGLTWGNGQNIETGGAVPPNAYFYSTLFNTSGGDPQVLGQNFSVFYVYPFGTWSNSSLYSVAISVPCTGSGPYICTAASANESDVSAVINGPTHTAGNGDTIKIPCSGTQSVTWTSTLTVTASITITGLGAVPNAGPSTFGAGTNCLTILDNNPSGPIWYLGPTYASSNNVTTLQSMNLDPINGSTTLGGIIFVQGIATASGFPQVRIDNIGFGIGTQWTESGNGDNTVDMIRVDNAVGVADHNTLPTGSLSNHLYTAQMSSYLGVGQWGDNSWAQPDTMGTATNWFAENNQTYINGSTFNDCTEAGVTVADSGGCRAVNRFNHSTGNNAFAYTAVHGLDSTGRPRSGRHTETYGNTLTCQFNCGDAAASFRGGTGIVFGNTGIANSGVFYNQIMDGTTYRIALANPYFGTCGGLNSIDPGDAVDNTVYVSGTLTAGGATTVSDTSKTWTTNQWAPTGANYFLLDTSQVVGSPPAAIGSQITSNTSNGLTVDGLINYGGTQFQTGDHYEIIRATVCEDQWGRGQGAYVSGVGTPTPTGPMNEVLDPVYEWDDTITPGSALGQQFGTQYAGLTIQNRDFYTDDWKTGGLSGPTAQTSATAPFNGSTTCNAGSGNYTCGMGFGALARRPTSCTTGTGYFATDQGTWNTSGNGFGQGVLYKCTATNTWTLGYVPYVYPHPLTGSGPPQVALPSFSPSSGVPPQTVTTTTSTGGATLCGRNDGGVPTATTAGTCDSAPTFTISGTQSVTVNPTTLTAIGTEVGFINSAVASATYSGSSPAATPVWTPVSGGYPYGYVITLSTSTSGCTSYIWWSSTNPPTTANGTNTQALNNYFAGTYYAKVIGCPGFADSGVATVTYTIVSGPPPPTSINAILNGAIQ